MEVIYVTKTLYLTLIGHRSSGDTWSAQHGYGNPKILYTKQFFDKSEKWLIMKIIVATLLHFAHHFGFPVLLLFKVRFGANPQRPRSFTSKLCIQWCCALQRTIWPLLFTVITNNYVNEYYIIWLKSTVYNKDLGADKVNSAQVSIHVFIPVFYVFLVGDFKNEFCFNNIKAEKGYIWVLAGVSALSCCFCLR